MNTFIQKLLSLLVCVLTPHAIQCMDYGIGILPWAINNNKIYFLLQKTPLNNGNNTQIDAWSNIGISSKDLTILRSKQEVAQRFATITVNFFGDWQKILHRMNAADAFASKEDRFSIRKDNGREVYKLYSLKVPFDAIPFETAFSQKIKWVPADVVSAALNAPTTTQFDGATFRTGFIDLLKQDAQFLAQFMKQPAATPALARQPVSHSGQIPVQQAKASYLGQPQPQKQTPPATQTPESLKVMLIIGTKMGSVTKHALVFIAAAAAQGITAGTKALYRYLANQKTITIKNDTGTPVTLQVTYGAQKPTYTTSDKTTTPITVDALETKTITFTTINQAKTIAIPPNRNATVELHKTAWKDYLYHQMYNRFMTKDPSFERIFMGDKNSITVTITLKP